MVSLQSLLPSTASFYLWRVSDGLMGLLFVVAYFAIYFCFGDQRFYQENAHFELGQNFFLLCGVAVFCFASSIAEDKSSQLVMLGLTLFCISMLVREVDVRDTDLAPYVSMATNFRIHYVVLFVLWGGLLFMIARQMGPTWRRAVQWLFSLPGAWFVTGLVLYAFGDASEKNLFTDKDHLAQMTEESAELLGTVFIFCASYVTLRRSTGLTTSQRTLSPDDER